METAAFFPLKIAVAENGQGKPRHHGGQHGAKGPDKRDFDRGPDILENQLEVLHTDELSCRGAGKACEGAEQHRDQRVTVYEAEKDRQRK